MKQCTQMTTRFNTEGLKDPAIRGDYEIRVGGRFEPLLQVKSSTDEVFKAGRDILKDEAENLLGRRRKVKQQWMTADILLSCDERRQAKHMKTILPTQENLIIYRRKCREVKSKCREGKKRWIVQLCERCEASHRRGHSSDLYKTVKDLTRVWNPQTNIVKNEDGQKHHYRKKLRGFGEPIMKMFCMALMNWLMKDFIQN